MKTFPLILATTAAAVGQSVVWWLEHKTSLRVARTKGNVSIMAATSPDKASVLHTTLRHMYTHSMQNATTHRRCWNKVQITDQQLTYIKCKRK